MPSRALALEPAYELCLDGAEMGSRQQGFQSGRQRGSQFPGADQSRGVDVNARDPFGNTPLQDLIRDVFRHEADDSVKIPSLVHEVLHSPGELLDAGTRVSMEALLSNATFR